MSKENKAIVEKVNAAFAEGNSEEFLSNCAEDVQWTMIGEAPKKGKKTIREWMKSMDGMEPPKFTVDNLIGDGDIVVANGDMTMKNKEGKADPYSYCDIYRFKDGEIVELNSFVIKTSATAAAAS